MDLTYAHEKLRDAASILASSPASLRDRIQSADACFHTLMGKHHLENLSPALRKRLTKINERLTRETAKGSEGSVRATLNEMSDDDAREMAMDIFDLFCEVLVLHRAQK